MSKIAVFSTITRLGRATFSRIEDATINAGESSRSITEPEYQAISALRASGKRWVVDISNAVREATSDEVDDGRTPREYLLQRIASVSNLTARASAYAMANDVFLALSNRDKDGAKAIIDASSLTTAQKTKVKSLIDRA